MPFAIATANCKLSKWKSPPHRAIDNTFHFNSYQHRSRPITLNCSIHSLITIQTHKMTKSEAFTTQPNPHRDNNYIIIVSLRTTTLLHDAFWSSHDDTNFDKGAGRPNEISQRSMSLLRFHRTHGETPKIHDPARNAFTKTSYILIKTALNLSNDEDVQNGPTSSKCLHKANDSTIPRVRKTLWWTRHTHGVSSC